MKRSSISIALALSCAALSAAATQRVEGEILVKFRPAAAAMADIYNRQIGAVKLGEISALGVQRIKLPSRVSVEAAKSYYDRLAAVEYSEPNIILQKDATPNDPLYSKQYSPVRMKANNAWDMTLGNDKVVVAVIDTGVDYTHPDLQGKVIKGTDWAGGDADPMDEEGHGTHVAGTIGAKTNNGVGVAGIGYNTSILAIRVLGPGGGTAEWVANGIIEATDKGADVINMSLGASAGSKVEEDAINYAWGKGVVIFAASGNDGVTDKHWPAAYDKVIAVGASDQNDLRAGFSNYGSDWVDVAAPGVDVMSTLPGNQYGLNSGTSMACPNAAGVAALVISYGEKGVITNQEVRDIIESTATPIGNWISKGRVDAQAAVSIAVPPIIETKAPTEAVMFDGSSFAGTAASLAANDGSYFKVNSRYVSQLGGVAGTQFSFSYPRTAKAWLSGTLRFRSFGVYNSTVTVYLKKNDGTFQLLKSFPVSGSQITQQVALPKDITSYLQNSKLTMVARAVLPYRYSTAPFTYSMNSAILETKSSSKVATP